MYRYMYMYVYVYVYAYVYVYVYVHVHVYVYVYMYMYMDMDMYRYHIYHKPSTIGDISRFITQFCDDLVLQKEDLCILSGIDGHRQPIAKNMGMFHRHGRYRISRRTVVGKTCRGE